METSVKATEVLVPPQSDMASSSSSSSPDTVGEAAAPPAACGSSSVNPMEEFNRRLEDIISTYGSAASALDKQSLMEVESEKTKTEAKADIAVAMEKEESLIMQSLKNISSPEKKLKELVRKYAELAALRHSDEKKLCVLQQLQAESQRSITARSKLETLCRELQGHYDTLREETLQRCREDEEKRQEMASHFQAKLTEIQAQIEQHSVRNDKLCHENTNLTNKLEGLMNQCELREESLEKINDRRDLQQKLTDAKLQQANALLAEAEEKHKREKEYLLVQAAEWKLQAQTLREQETVMQAQLTLYAQKFDEFQATLAKSNEIYTRFKKEMDNMSDKMKKMDKESNLWKQRFENCNKALTDMIEERAEKAREYDLFVLKIQKLEKLCNILQQERVVLYAKIKQVRTANSNIPARVFGSSNPDDVPDVEDADKSAPLTPVELQEIQEDDPVLTEDMSRLREQQTKLQEFADSLLASTSDNDDEKEKDDLDTEEDLMASAFGQFTTKTKVKKEVVSVPEQVAEVIPKPAVSPPEALTPVENASETTPANTKQEAAQVRPQVEEKEAEPVKPAEEIQQKPAEATSDPERVETNPPADLKTEAVEAEMSVETGEVKPVVPVEEEKVQAEPAQVPEEASTKTKSEKSPEATASSNASSSKKQTPKKKKKRTAKNAS
ncbi:beta-taxilin-like isoform X1 [Acanthopagrus latus]|uniref:beta-taxilin-like isoform X1 n=1 Tax=Acanthopagrus latus TaxID=8177 RepID=UPI00187BD5C6|nr:beta-taxilin-like isoform X1 [Acanthopagrus latus]